jgi:hypothetical protein
MRATDYTRTIDFAFQRWRVYRKVAHNTGTASAPVYRGDASRREQISLCQPGADLLPQSDVGPLWNHCGGLFRSNSQAA